MGVRATDDFNRADNADLGANWTPTNLSPWRITSNAATVSPLSNDNAEYYNADTPPDAQYAQAKVTIDNANADNAFNGAGPAVRMATGASTFYVAVAKNDRINIIEGAAGIFTSLGSFTTTWVDGDTLYIEAQGSAIKAFINGVERISVTDSTTTSGRYGVAYGSTVTSMSLDDWEGGDFAAAGADARHIAVVLGQAVARASVH